MQELPISAALIQLPGKTAALPGSPPAEAVDPLGTGTLDPGSFGALLALQLKDAASLTGEKDVPLASAGDAGKKGKAGDAPMDVLSTLNLNSLGNLIVPTPAIVAGQVGQSGGSSPPVEGGPGGAPAAASLLGLTIPAAQNSRQPVSAAGTPAETLPMSDQEDAHPSVASVAMGVVFLPVSNQENAPPSLSLQPFAVPEKNPASVPLFFSKETAGGAEGKPQAAEFAADGKILPPDLTAVREPRAADRLPIADTRTENTVASADPQPGRTDIAAAMPVLPASSPHPTAPQPHVLTVSHRVGAPEWNSAVGEKVVWMARQDHQVAELQLNPPHLGPLEVRLTLNNDQASIIFASGHAVVREAIESAMPRLRDMMAENGIMLGSATVSSESFAQQQQQAFAQKNEQGGGYGEKPGLGVDQALAPERGNAPAVILGRGLVDMFV
jgi:flagellar hook-length control protein FliK